MNRTNLDRKSILIAVISITLLVNSLVVLPSNVNLDLEYAYASNEIAAGGSKQTQVKIRGATYEKSMGSVNGSVVYGDTDGPVYNWTGKLYLLNEDGSRTWIKDISNKSSIINFEVPRPGSYQIDVLDDDSIANGSAVSKQKFGSTTAVVLEGQTANLGDIRLYDQKEFGVQNVGRYDSNGLSANPSEAPAGTAVSMRAQYNNTSDEPVNNATLLLEVPRGTSLVNGTVMLNGRQVTNVSMAGSYIQIFLSDLENDLASGVSTYRILVDENFTGLNFDAVAKINYNEKNATGNQQTNEEIIGIARVTVPQLTISAPSLLRTLDTTISGRGPTDSIVRILEENNKTLGETRVSAGGYWNIDISLPEREPPASYALRAEARTESVSILSDEVTVNFNPQEPQLTKVCMQQVDGQKFCFNPSNGIARFSYVTGVGNKPFDFELYFNNPNGVYSVFAGIEGPGGGIYEAILGEDGIYRARVVPKSISDGLGDIHVFYNSQPLHEMIDLGQGNGSATTLNGFEGIRQDGQGLLNRVNYYSIQDNSGQSTTELDRIYDLCTQHNYVQPDPQGDVIPCWDHFMEEAEDQWSKTNRAVPPEDAKKDLSELSESENQYKETRDPSHLNAFLEKHREMQENLKKVETLRKIARDEIEKRIPELRQEVEKEEVVLFPFGDGSVFTTSDAEELIKWGVTGGKVLVCLIPNVLTIACGIAGAAFVALAGIAAIKWLHDPSGYVYEAVPSNRLEGVTATVMQQNSTTGKLQTWDAKDFGQTNPQITDVEGRYGWDVPEGDWQVLYQKGGYEDAKSKLLHVPPPRTQVNIGMNSLDRLNITAVTAVILNSTIGSNGSSINILFNKYIPIDNLTNSTVTIYSLNSANDSNVSTDTKIVGKVKPVDPEPDLNETKLLTREIKFIPSNPLIENAVYQIIVNKTIQSYAGIPMEDDYISNITALSNINYSSTLNLPSVTTDGNNDTLALGQPISVTTNTNDTLSTKTRFIWYGPDPNPNPNNSINNNGSLIAMHKETIDAVNGTATSSPFYPTTNGTWKVDSVFTDGERTLNIESLNFNVTDPLLSLISDTQVNETVATDITNISEPADPSSLIISDIYNLTVAEDEIYPINYTIQGGGLLGITAQTNKTSLRIDINSTSNGTLEIDLPRNVIDSKSQQNNDEEFIVFVDNQNSYFEEKTKTNITTPNNNQTRTLSITFEKGAEEIEILGSRIIPEFGSVVFVILALALLVAILIIGRRRVIGYKLKL